VRFATGPTVAESVLEAADWTTRERLHHKRVDEFCEPHRRRAGAGEAHPVWDFLFTYYSLRPGQLRIWHPGFGLALGGTAAQRYLGRSGYARVGGGVTVTRGHLLARVDTVGFIAGLLRATASRPARLNCFGLHEWAMVYRAPAVRHPQIPLRLGPAGIDAVVESMPLRCSHFDAYRFFTGPATRLNADTLTRDSQVAAEQPGCVHANMDLYKWCYKLGPLIASELLMDSLDLAADARALDMRASPYDLTAYGIQPIPIEDAAGRTEYVRGQRDIARRAGWVREALLADCRRLVTLASHEEDR
jgi:hypothetical protein